MKLIMPVDTPGLSAMTFVTPTAFFDAFNYLPINDYKKKSLSMLSVA